MRIQDSFISPKKRRDWFIQVCGIMGLLVLIADYYLVSFDRLLWSFWKLPFELFCLLIVLMAIGKVNQDE